MIISTLSPETLESHPVFSPFIVPKTPQAAVERCQSGGLCLKWPRREELVSTLSLGTAVMSLGDLCAARPGSAGVECHLEEIQPVEFLTGVLYKVG